MNNHLSQDQMSRCILGQASVEEVEHSRNCPDCRAELRRFTGAVSTFQKVMTNWSDWEAMPRLEEATNSLPWRRWAVAGVAIAMLAAIPLFKQPEQQQAAPEPETNKDELLMQEVAAQLSRPLPLSMERVMVLLPEVQQGDAPEKKRGNPMKVRVITTCLVTAAMFLAQSMTAQIPASPVQTGSVSGVVRTATGAPAVGIRVTAMRADAMDDALRAMVSLTQTDATGRYHLDNVPPGRYYIAAGRVDLPTYYPGTLEVTSGTAVSISSAAPLSDIDFVIQDTSATVPPARGAFGLRARGAQPLPPTQSPTTRSRPAPAAPFSPQINRAPVVPRPSPAAPAPPPAPTLRYRVNTNLGTIASQPTAAWWTNAALVARLGLTADQMKKVEATFDQYRQAIVQNTTDLAREEAALSRLLEADPLEPAKTISTQIDKVIQARGELERTNSKMTLEMRQSLTRSQWIQLQSETQQPAQNTVRGIQLRANPVRPVTRGQGQNSAK